MDIKLDFIFSVTKTGLVVIPKYKNEFVILVSTDTRMDGVYIARVIPIEIAETNLDLDVSSIEVDEPTVFPVLNNWKFSYRVPKRTFESLKNLYREVEGKAVFDPNVKLYFSRTRIPLPENYEYLGRGYLFGEMYHLYLGGN